MVAENAANSGYFIGIDGGGTKTVCVLGDRTGAVLAVARGDSANVKSRPWDDVKRTLIGLIRQVLLLSNAEDSELEGVFLGLAGSDREDDKRRFAEWLRTELPEGVAITVHNDAITALAAGTWGERGLALISGTGSIAYGFDPAADRFVRVGGWGYLLGDEGSGFDLGRRALVAIMRHFDGRGEPTALTELAMQRWSLRHPEQLINTIYEQANVRSEIADASKLVVQAGAAGDPVAVRLAEEGVRALEELVRTAAGLMGVRLPSDAEVTGERPEERVPLVLSGGLFSDSWFFALFNRTATIRTGVFDVRPLLRPPVIGAYLLALRERGVALDESVRRRLDAADI